LLQYDRRSALLLNGVCRLINPLVAVDPDKAHCVVDGCKLLKRGEPQRRL